MAAIIVQKTNSNKAASGSAVTENKKTSRDVSDVDGPALKDLYAKYFMMGAAINGSDKSTQQFTMRAWQIF
ncbi:MAG: hypothetical protein ACLUGF_03175 [Clostridium sp.]